MTDHRYSRSRCSRGIHVYDDGQHAGKMFNCKRRQKARDTKLKDEIKEIVEKTTKDTMVDIDLKGTTESVSSGKVLRV